jgi:hypothetical protein
LPEPPSIRGVSVTSSAPRHRVVDSPDVVECLRIFDLVVADGEVEPHHLREPPIRDGPCRPHGLDCRAATWGVISANIEYSPIIRSQ